MTSKIKPTDVKDYFLKINRTLTLSLVSILIIASAIFWYTKAVTLDNSSLWIGAVFMILALLFYQLPYISYLYTRRHFKKERESDPEILISGWMQFKDWVES